MIWVMLSNTGFCGILIGNYSSVSPVTVLGEYNQGETKDRWTQILLVFIQGLSWSRAGGSDMSLLWEELLPKVSPGPFKLYITV